MIISSRKISLLIFLLLFPKFLQGQDQVGSIQGSVREAGGELISGVKVTAYSLSLIGQTSISFTNEQGFYRFRVLPPGNYQIKVESEGFQTAVRENIRVALGITVTVDFTLSVVDVSEEVIVYGEAPLIDRTTTATSFIVPNEILQNLPKPASITNILTLTPGVGDELVAFGAAGETANRIWIDGIDMTSPAVPALYAQYDYNWIEEAQVTGVGSPAEYGGYTGVVGNFVTKSGGNVFHGLVETFFENENLTSTNTPDPGPKEPFDSYEISAQIGGPILRDKLWFFSGIDYPHLQSHPFGYDGVVTQEYPKAITKLTYRMNKNNTLQGFVHYGYTRLDGVDAGFFTKPEATSIDGGPEVTWNATWVSLVSENTSLEGRFGGFWAHREEVPRNGDTHSYTDINGVLSRNAYSNSERTRFKPQASISFSHHADQYLGTHDFKFGTEIERSRTDFQISLNGGFAYYEYPYYTYILPGRDVAPPPDSNFDDGIWILQPDFKSHRFSSYAQDDWNLNDHFALSLGIRWDHNRGITERGTVFRTDPVAPRVGFIWKPRNQTIFKAHYGNYYDGLYDRLFLFLSDGDRGLIRQVFYGGDWVLNGGDRIVASSDSKVKHPFAREFTVGVDQEFRANLAVGAHYMHRDYENILENINVSDEYQPVPFVNPLSGETIYVFARTSILPAPSLLTNPPGLFRKYDGIEVFANKRFFDNLSLSASFVYSKTTGNVPNVSIDVYGVFTDFLNDPNQLINFEGHVVNDPTSAWKIYGTYNLPWGFQTGWFFRHQSGDTWAATYQVPRAILHSNTSILLEPLGSRRLPSQNILDLRVEKQFQIYNGHLALAADIFNLFNSAYVTSVDSRFELPSFGTPTGYTEPRKIHLGLRYSF